MSETIINEKTHIELPLYLSIEHNILRNKEYKRCLEYIEELINRNVLFFDKISAGPLCEPGLDNSNYVSQVHIFMVRIFS